nr:hypothetical protein [uncultured Mediterranean phage uvMED]
MYYNSSYLLFIINIKKITNFSTSYQKKMRTYLLLFTFLLLAWQGITISTTLANRLQERTNQINSILIDYQENK